jgi:hypothetical protein
VRLARNEALPHAPPGGKPPETPSSLSLSFHSGGEKKLVKGSQAAPSSAPLTNFFSPETLTWDEGKGAFGLALSFCSAFKCQGCPGTFCQLSPGT